MTTQRVRAQIQLANILHNYTYIQSRVSSNCKVLAVVKANAYGHGAVRICRMLHSIGCEYFAVACIDEAICLRQNGIQGNILILGNTDPSYGKQLEELDIIQAVDTLDYAQALAKNGNVKVHIKVDTGMSRLGIYCHHPADASPAADLIQKISAIPQIHIEGIFTHFADSDGSSEEFTRQQFSAFQSLLDELQKRGISVGLRHCCNSAGILRFPEMHLDMVRAGIILYGCMPSEYIHDRNLKPAMKLIARISAVNTIRKGDSVSYGCTYTAEKDMKVAVLSIGYADGLSRALSGNLSVRINGIDVPLIGKICMDLCMADVSNADCRVGDEAIVFDSAEKIDEIAAKLQTINYEVLCSLKKRVVIEYV